MVTNVSDVKRAELEERLKHYRSQKQVDDWKSRISNLYQFVIQIPIKSFALLIAGWNWFDSIVIDSSCLQGRKLVVSVVVFLLWIYSFRIAFQIQFALVYFAVSLLLFIYLSTRKRNITSSSGLKSTKKEPEVSAYSVFNKNCERIPGTFTAEQFEASLRKGNVL